MNHDQLRDTHRARLAYVYIRQSSAHQVQHHTESQRRQRDLMQRAVELGWSGERVKLIDEDLGRSGGRSERRSGFEKLLADVAMGLVGIVFALEVSRMSRGNRAWYHLLDVCAVTHTLIADDDALYDPRVYNDRLLLGLKGTMSEAESFVMNQRLVEARRSKAARGELRVRLPAGYFWDELGRIQKTADEQERSAIERVFSLFAEQGSLNATHRALIEERMELPVRVGRGTQIEWRIPSAHYVIRLLKHPVYAGAYVWGRRRVEESLDEQQRAVKKVREVERDAWRVLIKEHHEGYISWEQFERNQRQIAGNRKGAPGPGAARGGSALLQGLMLCGRCGRKMSVNYHTVRRVLRYVCNGGAGPFATGHCQNVGAVRLERAFDELMLEALSPLALEAMARASAVHVAGREQHCEHWRQRVERAQYEVDVARRQYDAVDPTNRLVVRELERRWERALQALSSTQAEAQAQLANLQQPLSEQECAELGRYGHDIAELWQAATTSAREKKRIIRCLVENVVVTAQEAAIQAKVHWVGGEVTTIEVPKGKVGMHRYVTDPEVVELVRSLAEQFADDQIASILHHKRLRTSKGLTFRAQHVTNLRRVYGIEGHTRAKLEAGHVYSAQQATQIFGVSQRTIENWLSTGLLRGTQVTIGAPWRIEITPADRERLCPQDMPPDWVTLKRAAHVLGVTQQTVLNKLKRGELEGVRVSVGARTAWRIRLDSSACDKQATLFT